MKLTKINYVSAVYFAAITLIMYEVLAVLQWSLRSVLAAQGISITLVNTFITAPIIGAVVGYLAVIVMILVYNLVAKKYPISWEIKK